MKVDISNYDLIPEHMMISLNQYIRFGYRVGSFLKSVLANDLIGAISKADDTNLNLLAVYVHYLHWEAPSSCYGSYENVENWYQYKDKERESQKD